MSKRDIVIFAGSSLERSDRTLDNAWYKPPVQQGDVFEAVELARPRAIAIIDGLFQHVPAVRDYEILWALHRGVQVFGSSSMGALRAAELAPVGMIGVGLIYRWYRRAMLAGDDEVAQALAPAELGMHAASEALIEMRLTFRRAERAGQIDTGLRCELEACAKKLFFADRTYAAVLDIVSQTGPASRRQTLERLESWIPGNHVPQKRIDARKLIAVLAAGEWCQRAIAQAADAFPITGSWLNDLRQSGLASLLTDWLDVQRPRR